MAIEKFESNYIGRRVRLKGNLYKPILPENSVSIVRPSKYGNPYKVKDFGREEALKKFEKDLLESKLKFTIKDIQEDLRGRDLACWCKENENCHGDILIKYIYQKDK